MFVTVANKLARTGTRSVASTRLASIEFPNHIDFSDSTSCSCIDPTPCHQALNAILRGREMQWRGLLTATLVASALKAIAAADQPLTSLTRQLESANSQEQIRAAQTLSELGPRAAAAVPNLVKSLQTEDLALRFEVVMALGRISSNADLSVPALISALSDKAPIIQHAGIESLRSFGSDARPALPLLKTLLTSKEVHVRIGAARAIATIAYDDQAQMSAAIPVLIGGLSQEPSAAGEAILGLAAIGPAAVPALQRALAATESGTRINGADTLSAIGPGSRTGSGSRCWRLRDRMIRKSVRTPFAPWDRSDPSQKSLFPR